MTLCRSFSSLELDGFTRLYGILTCTGRVGSLMSHFSPAYDCWFIIMPPKKSQSPPVAPRDRVQIALISKVSLCRP